MKGGNLHPPLCLLACLNVCLSLAVLAGLPFRFGWPRSILLSRFGYMYLYSGSPFWRAHDRCMIPPVSSVPAIQQAFLIVLFLF